MDFSCKKGPIFFNDLRSGVFFDKREEEKGWDQPGFQEDENWHKPILTDRPRGKAKLCEAEPIAVVEERKPVKIWKGALADYTPRGDVRKGCADRPHRKADWKKRAVTFMILERTMPEFSA